MVLKMARPWKHPATHVFYYRRVVPEDLRAVVGKREIRKSLGTKDPEIARVEHARVAAEIEQRWSSLRRGVQTVSHREAVAIAGEFYRTLIEENEEEPGEEWRLISAHLFDGLAAGDPKVRVVASGSTDITDRMLEKLKNTHRPAVEQFLAQEGTMVDDESFNRILGAVNVAMSQGRKQLINYARGDYRADPNADRFPPRKKDAETSVEPMGEKFSLVSVYERYRKEAGHSPATVKRWTPIIRRVATDCPDIRDITPDWCVSWKDQLLEEGKAATSVNDAYLAALRSTCAWALDNKLIPSNPVAGIRTRVPKKQQTRSKGFTDDEAMSILQATRAEVIENISPEHRAARRWLPWLCAYSGARVGEIAQLRGCDVLMDEGVWLMFITPEAGSTKNGNARYVAIHEDLLEQGFIQFVESAGKGPLFYSMQRKRGGTEANPLSKKTGERIARWVRSIGVDDRRVQPNHGWRHRFKTLSRRHDIDPGARDYLQGHVPHNESEKYGDFEPMVLYREIMKLPRYQF